MTQQQNHLDALLGACQRPYPNVDRANAILGDLYAAAARGEIIVARGRVRLPTILDGFALVLHVIWPEPGQDLTDAKSKGWLYRAAFLRRLLDVSGLRIDETKRMDDGSDPNLRAFRVTVTGKDLLHRQRQWIGDYELDLRDGSARDGMKATQMREKRTHISQLAATGAMTRAVVDALAIDRGFKTVEEATRAVVIPTIALHVESASESVRGMISQAAVLAEFGMFGPATQRPAAIDAPPARAALESPSAGTDDDEPFLDDDIPDDLPDDDVPFGGPGDDEPPASPEPDRPITAAEQQELKDRGLWQAERLMQFGYSGKGKVMLSTYRGILGAAR